MHRHEIHIPILLVVLRDAVVDAHAEAELQELERDVFVYGAEAILFVFIDDMVDEAELSASEKSAVLGYVLAARSVAATTAAVR